MEHAVNNRAITKDEYLRERQAYAAEVYQAARVARDFRAFGTPYDAVRFQRAAARAAKSLRVELGIEVES